MALAVSSIRLAQKKVLLHDMKCIETLARVDVLCVDTVSYTHLFWYAEDGERTCDHA